jgi:unsaturated rhamnogalacturonyl hydrolase
MNLYGARASRPLLGLVAWFAAICSAQDLATVSVVNPLQAARSQETVSISGSALKGLKLDHIVVIDGSKEIICQAIDNDADGVSDELIFQSDFAAGETKSFVLRDGQPAQTESPVFCRFVPERMDDFAWENDRVAHRIYGPALQAKELTSSGIDVWCKRVRTPVINLWYKRGEYHSDHGEGGDFYSIGKARGCGGTGIWRDGKLFVSENFKTWKLLANGPVRLMFELTYSKWDAGGVKVSELKRISLDAGTNLSRVQSTFTSDDGSAVPFAAGMFKHIKTGSVKMNKASGWVRFWGAAEKGNGSIGTSLLMPAALIKDTAELEPNVLAIGSAQSGTPATYFIGACWDRSGDFADEKAWDAYLESAAQRLAAPLQVNVTLNAGKN